MPSSTQARSIHSAGSSDDRDAPVPDPHPSLSRSPAQLRNSPPPHLRRHPVPSITVLTMLATFCAESVVAIHPVAYRCPNFLCPFLAHPYQQTTHLPVPSSSKASRPQPVPKRKNAPVRRSLPNGNVPQKLPTKYLKGQDGRYHLESSYSLHGQTLSCAWVPPSPSAVDEMDNVDDPVSPATAVGLPVNSALPTPSSTYAQPPDDLPAGWGATPQARSGFYQVPVIIVFALTLTLFITVLIASCALLRRKRRLRRLKNLKKEVGSEIEQGPDDVENPSFIKRIRKQKKVLARSSARWRSNARSALRRRRGKSSALPNAICPSPSESTHSPIESADVTEAPDEPVMEVVPTARLASLPPAYPSRNEEHPGSGSSEIQEEDQLPNPTQKQTSSERSLDPQSQDTSAPPSTSMYGAHLATDDKAVLERMANSASSPAVTDRIAASPQAPEWCEHDDEISHSSGLSQMHFPLPGLPVEPTIVCIYNEGDDDMESIPLAPSSPSSSHQPYPADVPSAPPIEDY